MQTKVGRTTRSKVPTVVLSHTRTGDQYPDIVSGTVLYRSTPSGLEGTPSVIGMEAQTITSISSSDIDGDGLPDLVASFQENPTTPLRRSGIKVFINPGSSDFSTVTPFLVGDPDQETEAVTSVDVNDDGRPDIIAGNRAQRNKVYLNRGRNDFTTGIDIGSEMDDTTSVEV